MATALYDKAREAFASFSSAGLAAAIDLETDTIRVCLVKAAYVPDLVNHQFFTSLGANVVGNAGGATRGDCPALAGKAVDGTGLFNATDATISLVPAGAGVCNEVALFKDTGADATSPLICLIDNATGLPVTPGGGNITIEWDNGLFLIFKL